MNRFTFSLGRWFGIPIYLHWSWSLLGIILLIFNPTFVPLWLCLFGIIILHEFGHIFAGRLFGINADNITLLPIGGAAYMKIPPRGRAEFVIAIAGPAVNALLAFPLYGLWRMFPEGSLSGQLFAINIVIMVFNLLPAFPMDGGRVLRALLVMVTGNPRTSTLIAVRTSQLFCIFMGVTGIYFMAWMLVLVAAFIALAAEAGWQQMKTAPQLRGETVPTYQGDGGEAARNAVQASQRLVDQIDRRMSEINRKYSG